MTTRCALPPHAYVPGQTARHPEGLFDTIRDTARPGMTVEALGRCDAWLCGWEFLDAGFFWEAHEVWEPVWMALPPNSTERRFSQAAIQLANAELKLRMERPKAALRLCDLVEEQLSGLRLQRCVLGIEPAELAERVVALRKRISR